MRKSQTPKSKFQRNSKHQVSRERGKKAYGYSDFVVQSLTVKEEPNGSGEKKHPFDLEERTAQLGEAIVRFCKKIPRDPTNDRLVGQLAACGTSVGANYCEANERVSKKDFRNIISRCVKEAKETRYSLRLIATAEPRLATEARQLYREAKELHLIFATIFRK